MRRRLVWIILAVVAASSFIGYRLLRHELTGNWELVSLDVAGEEVPLPAGPSRSFTFAISFDGTINGDSACNSFGGPRLRYEDGELTASGGFSSTLVACGRWNDIEERFTALMFGPTAVERDDGLMYWSDGETGMEFHRLPFFFSRPSNS
jgi:heat shock protein HslJ